jgi:hypothetical protein
MPPLSATNVTQTGTECGSVPRDAEDGLSYDMANSGSYVTRRFCMAWIPEVCVSSDKAVRHIKQGYHSCNHNLW